LPKNPQKWDWVRNRGKFGVFWGAGSQVFGPAL